MALEKKKIAVGNESPEMTVQKRPMTKYNLVLKVSAKEKTSPKVARGASTASVVGSFVIVLSSPLSTVSFFSVVIVSRRRFRWDS